MRPTGRLHLGHYHGVLKQWVELQAVHECFFFVADWHALTTHYEKTGDIADNVVEMVIDWLACGINPESATLFVQSRIAEHAELHLLLSMVVPLSWLERVPSYKDHRERMRDRDLSTYGFLGYPLLQSADIFAYKATLVPVGEDQVAHVELAREVARRFNYLYGREADFEERAEQAIGKMGKKNASLYRKLRKSYQENGDTEAFNVARALIGSQQNLQVVARERLYGYLEGAGRILLPEPGTLLTEAPKVPGTDGTKMSKSHGNTITLRESDEEIETRLRTMPTDPARVKRTDPGDPQNCPVWPLHRIYSSREIRDWVQQGCRSADIGCVECKQPVIDAVKAEVGPIRARATEYAENRQMVQKIITEGNEAARSVAHDTLDEVRKAMGIAYR